MRVIDSEGPATERLWRFASVGPDGRPAYVRASHEAIARDIAKRWFETMGLQNMPRATILAATIIPNRYVLVTEQSDGALLVEEINNAQ